MLIKNIINKGDKMKELADKVAVVTGGNSGIGLAITDIFIKNGAKVVIFDKNIDGVINKYNNPNVISVEGDLRNLSDIDKLYTCAFDNFGKIDIIAASAGVGKVVDINDITEELFDQIVDVNYKGTFFTVQKSVKYLNNNASIILISSTAAHRAVHGKSIYASTKAAISRLAKNFAADLAHKQIRVNAVSPGTIDTPMLGADLSEDFMRKIGSHIPFKYIGSPDNIAEYALFLASDKSIYITGTDLTIDGGLSGFIV